jgi:hypothetical protein
MTTEPALTAVARHLAAVVAAAAKRLARTSEESAGRRPAPGKWSPKEVLGHLIDSAANNHQRFVRMQLLPHLELPGYAQDDWVRLAGYHDLPWRDLCELWAGYNRLLAHLLARADPATLRHTWTLGDGRRVDLEWVARDYVLHMRHHLGRLWE